MSTYIIRSADSRFVRRNVAIERRGRDTEALCDLGDTNIWIGEHCLCDIKVLFCQFRRTASGAAGAPSSGKSRLGTFPDQASLEFRERTKHMKNQSSLRSRRVEGLGQAGNPMPLTRRFSTVWINCFIERASRSSFQTISVSPLRANSRASCKAGPIRNRARICSVKIFCTLLRSARRAARQGSGRRSNSCIADQHWFRRDVAGIG